MTLNEIKAIVDESHDGFESLIDSDRNRVLTEEGVSVYDIDTLASMIIADKDMIRMIEQGWVSVVDSDEADAYQTFFETPIIFDRGTHKLDPIKHHMKYPVTNMDTPSAIRYNEAVNKHGKQKVEERYNHEHSFFYRNQENLLLIKQAIYVVNALRRENIPWGVGRGSSCASFFLYLHGIHDIDPLEYDIPFSELSKENENDY